MSQCLQHFSFLLFAQVVYRGYSGGSCRQFNCTVFGCDANYFNFHLNFDSPNIYIYIFGVSFVFRASVTDIYNISRFRKHGTNRQSHLGRKLFLWILNCLISRTLLWEALLPSWVPVSVKKQDCEWIVLQFSAEGKRSMHSPVRLGELKANFWFFFSFWFWINNRTKSEKIGKATAQMKEEYCNWTGSHVTSHRKPASLL